MENQKDLTERQKFQAAKGKEVPLDYFLYTCMEHERTQKSIEGAEVIQWEGLAGQEEGNLTGPLAESKLKELLREMTMWYRDTYPAMSSTQKLDHEQLLKVVDPFTSFNKDIAILYRLKCGEDIPTFEGSIGNNMIWEDVNEMIGIFFESYFHLFSRYVIWSHSSNPTEATVPGSRPPVGKYAPRRSDRPGGRDSGPRGNSGGPRGNSGGPRGNSGGPRGNSGGPRGNSGGPRGNARGGRGKSFDPGKDSMGNSGQHDTRGGRGPVGEGAPQGNRSNQGGGRGDRNRGPRNDRNEKGGRGRDRGRGRDNRPKRDEKENAKLEAAAMSEVQNAIDNLKSDTAADEVILKPNNSFYRRLQHQRAVEMGFDSFSVGEGPDRSVRIARKSDD